MAHKFWAVRSDLSWIEVRKHCCQTQLVVLGEGFLCAPSEQSIVEFMGQGRWKHTVFLADGSIPCNVGHQTFFCNNWHWLSLWRLSIFHNGNLISIKFFPHAHGKGPDFFCDKGQYLQILRCLGWRPWRQTDIVNMQAFWGYVPPEPRLGEGAWGGGYDSTKNLSTLSAIFTNLFWKGFSKGRSY